MKTIHFLTAFILLSLAFSSCTKDACEREVTWIESTPIYKTIDEIRAPISSESARELRNPGKIYFFNSYIFINEIREGVHVVDNSNPESPQRLGFIKIPGNVDIAIKGEVLYADNYIDLLAIDIKDPLNVNLLHRNENVFQPLWEEGEGVFAVDYLTEEKTEIMDCESTNRFVNRGGIFFANDFSAEIAFDNVSTSGSGGATQTGIGGSLARFTIVDTYLYSIDQSQLHVFDLADCAHPNEVSEVNVAWNIETIFPYQDKLFIAGNNGLFIYDNSNPTQPTYLSQFQHATACDPVYVKDNYAYVTLRSGTRCDGSRLNQLDLIDISDILNPRLERTFPMDNPHGLGIKGNTLYLCEGEHGIKVFDIEKPKELANHLIDRVKNIHAFDAIPLPGQRDILLVIGDDGFYQYDSSNPSKLELISSILVEK